jgi:hypothetical protein
VDAIPGDLDLVVRLDLARLREALGPGADAELARRMSGDPLVARALVAARAVAVGVRVANLDRGDYVLAIDGPPGSLPSEAEGFTPLALGLDRIAVVVREGRVPRSDVGLVATLGDRGTLIASAVETDAVLRVLANGPDEPRARPVADALASAELRAAMPPAWIARKYPSFSRIAAALERVRAAVRVEGDRLRVEVELAARSQGGAESVARFCEAVRAGADPAGDSALLGTLAIDTLGRTVRLGLDVPPALVLAWLTKLTPSTEPSMGSTSVGASPTPAPR